MILHFKWDHVAAVLQVGDAVKRVLSYLTQIVWQFEYWCHLRVSKEVLEVFEREEEWEEEVWKRMRMSFVL
jgi:hypothetical protein